MYTIVVGWAGLVWTSGVPGVAVVVPRDDSTTTPRRDAVARAEALVPGFHAQAWTVEFTLEDALDACFGWTRPGLVVDQIVWSTTS
jgi:hypothetical protein